MEDITSDIVKVIYDLFLSGKNVQEIKIRLYGQGIHRPTDYKAYGHIYCQEGEELREWPRATVKRILTNPVYAGWPAWESYGRDFDRNNYAHMERNHEGDIHEAIIDKELFARAASKFEENSVRRLQKKCSETVSSENDMYANVLFCGECGTGMHRTSTVKRLHSGETVRRYYYFCPGSKRIDECRCGKKNIPAQKLTELVTFALHRECAFSALRPEDLAGKHTREEAPRRTDQTCCLCECERKIECVKRGMSERYAKYRMGELCLEEFRKEKAENDSRIAALLRQKEEMEHALKMTATESSDRITVLRNLLNSNGKPELSEEIIRTMIHRIEVYPDRRVRIIFAFRRGIVPQ